MYELHFVALCMLMFLSFFLLWISEPPARRRSWQQRPRAGGGETRRGFQPPKPRWVRDDVIRLKALMPDHGCRAIAAVFNHLYSRRRMTVGKSFVADVVRRHRLDVVRRRREMKHRKPRQLPKNLIWATDLTFVADELADKPRPVLGLIDHGTRA
ncbi:MAG: hypothetical protein GY719_12845, partial [bacterium]|nr:hypothetical protein [bacterium]